jgi:hypothetical protein
MDEPQSFTLHQALGFEVPHWAEQQAFQFASANGIPFEDAFWELVMVGHIDLDNMWQVHAALIEKQFATIH